MQEDAFRLTFAGSKAAGVKNSHVNGESVDFTSGLGQHSALVVTARRESDISAAIMLSMYCDDEQEDQKSCMASIDIAKYLSQIPKGQWQNISIDLQCFANQGM